MATAKRSTRVTVADLPDSLHTMSHPRPLLWCSICSQESSANRGDYFMARPDHVFRCCRRNMRLVVKCITYVPYAA